MKRWLKKIGEKITGSKPEEDVKEKNKTTSKDTDKIEVIETIQKDHNTDHKLTVVGADKKNSISSTKLKEKKNKVTWFHKLGDNFKKTSSNIKKAMFASKISQEALDHLEEAFLMSDLGVSFTNELLTDLKTKKIENGKLGNEVRQFLQDQFLENNNEFKFKKTSKPQIILFFGVNGSGKTTTLAKLASRALDEGLRTKIIAADTFRAAAVEQLLEWGKKLELDVFTGFHNEDPSSVIFKGHKEAIENKTEVLLIDTAGRLHNKIELMDELKKIVRTIQKNDPSGPHEKILILDSTIGQNTYSQIESFTSSIGITGVIMTKLDSSAKGGSLIGISKKYKLPIYFIGVGEKVDDLINFNIEDFIDALIGNNFGDRNESIH